jgi:hypothetical protein
VAAGADFDADIAFVGRARFERVAAGADDVDLFVGGVDTGFHMFFSRFSLGETSV